MTDKAQHEARPRRGGSGFRGLGRGLGLGLASTLQCGFGRLRCGSSCSVGRGGLLRGQGSGRGRLGSRGRLSCEVQQGLLYFALPLWLRSQGPKVLSQGTGGHEHGDNWGSWRATIGVRIHVTIVSDMGRGESRWKDGPRGDWRDRGVGAQVITGGWEVAEPAEGCKGIVEFDAVTVGHRKLGCQPNQEEGRHESFGLIDDGEFVDHEEDRVHVRHRDHHVVDECGDGFQHRKAE